MYKRIGLAIGRSVALRFMVMVPVIILSCPAAERGAGCGTRGGEGGNDDRPDIPMMDSADGWRVWESPPVSRQNGMVGSDASGDGKRVGARWCQTYPETGDLLVSTNDPGLRRLEASAPTPPANTDWMKDAKYGVFMHFLPGDAKGLALVEKFDVESLARQLEESGAKYFVITLGQNSGYFNSPNGTYDRMTGYAPGERCATRDLPLDLYAALHRRDIRLMIYLPCQTPNRDARAQKAFGLPAGARDQPIDMAFAEKWSLVIREWADRYGEKVDGWWFDGGYQHIRFNEAIAARYAAAVKHGNPKAVVTFNPGVKIIHYTAAEDYTAGETNNPLGVLPAGRWLGGSQWHVLTFIGSHWGARDTRFSDDQWSRWAHDVTAKEGVITFDMGPNYDPAEGPVGSLAECQMKQIKAIKSVLEKGRKHE